MTATAGGDPPRLAVGVTGTEIRSLTPTARAVPKEILRAFATTGRAPDPATLAGAAAGDDLGTLLRELHERDVVRLDGLGGMRGHTRSPPCRPDTAVVLDGADTTVADACRPPEGAAGCSVAAQRCCRVMNFFTSTDSALSWLAAHPRVSGFVLTKEQALQLGIDIFGHLLDD